MLILTLSCAMGAFSTIGILIPNGLTSGGITGVARILQGFINIEFSILYYIGSLIILVVCALLLGIKEARKIVLLAIMFPAFLLLFEKFSITLLEEKDVLLAAIYCGIFTGISSGLAFTRGYSFGGTDTIAKIIQKKMVPHIGLSKILLAIDAIIIISSGILFGRNIALYALITQVILAKTIDFVMYGIETKTVQMEVITDKYQEVAEYILHEVSRGVSSVSIKGEYSKVPRQKIVTICSPRESMIIKRFIAEVDQDAFVTIIPVSSVWGKGQGFRDILKEE